jgi:N-methylhydantoinase A
VAVRDDERDLRERSGAGPRVAMSASSIRAATDVGGTFTDLAYFEIDPATGSQRVVVEKADTTPGEFDRGVAAVIRKAGLSPSEIAFMAHGTTVVINAITERKGSVTGLITSEGFRDSLEIARGNRPDFFNLAYRKPPPFVPRHLRRELPGRLTQHGEERVPLDLSALPEILADFEREGVEAVAICLINAYAEPRHERAVRDAVARAWPEVSVVASHEIVREWREYERTSTTVLSAYVQPPTERYLTRLANGAADEGFRGQLYIMQSNCGVDSVDRTKRVPITMVESGPASGVWGAAELGRLIGEPNVLALDIGGTTAKCSLIRDGTVRVMTDYWIERDTRSAGYPIMTPVVDLVEIGQGGGSIAWVDEFAKLHVGPRSAGALPGPAAYGRGGTAATTTDANLALGRINPDYFVGGEVAADMDAVDRALRAVGDPLGLSPIEAARGIVRIADHNMVNALKLVSVNRGHDPRDFVLVAFGGGGGMHAAALAAELGIGKVVIPHAASVFAAWGMLMSDLRSDLFVTRVERFDATSATAIGEVVAATEDAARAQFVENGVSADAIHCVSYAKLRYENQEHSVEVALPEGPSAEASIAATIISFHENYEREYTYRLDAPVELVGVHTVATAAIGKLRPTELPVTGRTLEAAIKARREVDFAPEDVCEAAVFDGSLLEPGMRGEGPAVIETAGTTMVIRPGNRFEIDRFGNLHLSTGATAA